MLVAGEQIVAEGGGDPRLQYFFPLALELFLNHAGFDVIQMAPFDDAERALDASTWNMLVVARRR